MKTINPSEVKAAGDKNTIPTVELYNQYKNSKLNKRQKKGSRLKRIKEIEDCLDHFPEENPLVKDSPMGKLEVPYWAKKDENGRVSPIESAQYSKVYRMAINKRVLYKLPNAAHALFNWIILNQNGRGYVFLNEPKIRKEMAGLKHYNTFYKSALESLITAGIIVEYHKPYYLINPRLTHFGSRVKSYPRFSTTKDASLCDQEIDEEAF